MKHKTKKEKKNYTKISKTQTLKDKKEENKQRVMRTKTLLTIPGINTIILSTKILQKDGKLNRFHESRAESQTYGSPMYNALGANVTVASCCHLTIHGHS